MAPPPDSPADVERLTEQPSVGVLIINWNQPELAVRACRSALASTGVQTRVIIIDNGSRKGSIQAIASALTARAWKDAQIEGRTVLSCSDLPEVIVLAMGSNLGFTGANNVGMDYAFNYLGLDYCFLLNCDAFLDPACLRRTVAVAASGGADIGLVGALTLDGSDPTRISFGRSLLSRSGWPISPDHNVDRACAPVSGISREELIGGAAMLIPRGTYRQIGGQDDRFFFDVDDTEYSLRSKRAGFENYMVWDAIAYHDMGSSVQGRSNLSRYYNLRNLLLLHSLYHQGGLKWRFRIRFGFRLFRDVAAAVVKRDRPRIRAVVAALRDYRGGRFGIGPDEIYRTANRS